MPNKSGFAVLFILLVTFHPPQHSAATACPVCSHDVRRTVKASRRYMAGVKSFMADENYTPVDDSGVIHETPDGKMILKPTAVPLSARSVLANALPLIMDDFVELQRCLQPEVVEAPPHPQSMNRGVSRRGVADYYMVVAHVRSGDDIRTIAYKYTPKTARAAGRLQEAYVIILPDEAERVYSYETPKGPAVAVKFIDSIQDCRQGFYAEIYKTDNAAVNVSAQGAKFLRYLQADKPFFVEAGLQIEQSDEDHLTVQEFLAAKNDGPEGGSFKGAYGMELSKVTRVPYGAREVVELYLADTMRELVNKEHAAMLASKIKAKESGSTRAAAGQSVYMHSQSRLHTSTPRKASGSTRAAAVQSAYVQSRTKVKVEQRQGGGVNDGVTDYYILVQLGHYPAIAYKYAPYLQEEDLRLNGKLSEALIVRLPSADSKGVFSYDAGVYGRGVRAPTALQVHTTVKTTVQRRAAAVAKPAYKLTARIYNNKGRRYLLQYDELEALRTEQPLFVLAGGQLQ